MQNKKVFAGYSAYGEFGRGQLSLDFILKLATASLLVLRRIYPDFSNTLRIEDVLAGASLMQASLPAGAGKKKVVTETTLLTEQTAPSSPAVPLVRAPYAMIIGWDTRSSGCSIQSAIASALSALGVDVYLAGVCTTPLLAQLTREVVALAGIMITAGDDPYEINGIQFFDPYGFLIHSELQEDIIKHACRQSADSDDGLLIEESKIDAKSPCGGIYTLPAHTKDQYQQQCFNVFAGKDATPPLAGLKIVVDCAHGAAYQLAPMILQHLGAEIIPFAVEPSGLNINLDCGASTPQTLRMLMLTHQADIGLAFNGDGSRVCISDAAGELYDSDRLLYLLASYPLAGEKLAAKKVEGVVVTVASDLGVQWALQKQGIDVSCVSYDDLAVISCLQEKRWSLAVGQQQQLIDLSASSTADGLLTSLRILRILKDSGQSLAELLADVPVCQRMQTDMVYAVEFSLQHPKIIDTMARAEWMLQDKGQLSLYLSPHEPLLHVLLQGVDSLLLERVSAEVTAAIKAFFAEIEAENQ